MNYLIPKNLNKENNDIIPRCDAMLILFDETHDEGVSIEDEGVSGFFNFAQELKNQGYEVKKSEKSLQEDLENVKVLVLAVPQSEFKQEERIIIRDFVKNGGGLFLIGEWGNLHLVADCLNSISDQFGVKFRNDRLTDFDACYDRDAEIMKDVLGAGKMAYLLRLFDFSTHPITRDIKSIGYLAGCTLDTDEKSTLVRTDETCFADKKRIDEFQQISEMSGPFIVAAFKEFEKGRVLCSGDSSTFSNRFIGTEDNKRFGLQIINWLSQQ